MARNEIKTYDWTCEDCKAHIEVRGERPPEGWKLKAKDLATFYGGSTIYEYLCTECAGHENNG